MNLRPASYLFFSLADVSKWLLIDSLPDYVVFNLIKTGLGKINAKKPKACDCF